MHGLLWWVGVVQAVPWLVNTLAAIPGAANTLAKFDSVCIKVLSDKEKVISPPTHTIVC
jgi:hypothetical protein